MIDQENNDLMLLNWKMAIMKLRGFEENGLIGWTYTEKFNLKPLAAMLAACSNPPDFVLKSISNFLLGTTEFPIIQLKPPKDQTEFLRFIDRISEMRRARAEFQNKIETCRNRKDAIASISADFQKGRSWVEEALKLDDEKYIDTLVKGNLPDSIKKRQRRKESGQKQKMSGMNS